MFTRFSVGATLIGLVALQTFGCAANSQRGASDVRPRNGVWSFTPAGAAGDHWRILAGQDNAVTVRLTFDDGHNVRVTEMMENAPPAGNAGQLGAWGNGMAGFAILRNANAGRQHYRFDLQVLGEEQLGGEVRVFSDSEAAADNLDAFDVTKEPRFKVGAEATVHGVYQGP